MSLILILFVVCMLLWLLGIFAPSTPPYTYGRPIVAWLSVLFLFLLLHGTRGLS